MERKVNLCNPVNYGGLRVQPIKYIVIHYTGNDGDTDEANAAYFARANTGKTSAHWFVDDDSATLSVPEDRIAYHCGANYYYHKECRNANSIGIELCDTIKNGEYGFTEKTLSNAAGLVRELMVKYNIPIENVVRHYDVTHKICPEPFCRKGQKAWEEFKQRLEDNSVVRYNKISDMPAYASKTVIKLVDRGLLNGNGGDKDENGRPADLDLSTDMLRLLVIQDRAGVFDL